MIIDVALDVGQIAYDLYRIAKDNIFGNCDNLGENLLALGADVAGALIPFATGGGAAVRAGRAANQAIDATRAAERTADATRNIDRAADATKGLDNAGDAAKSSNVADTQKALNPTNCFIAGTEIITREGTKNIEDIQVGDWVLSDDPNTVGEIEYKQVLQTFARSATATIDIFIDGERITTTEEHPFWVPGVGWVLAKDLNVGNYLQTKTESWLDIDKIESHTSLINVYNFEVEGFHTYFVSDLGLLVHNSNCGEKVTYPQPQSPLPGSPITMDQAVDLATNHVNGTGKVVTSGSGGIQYVSKTVDSSGESITKIARFDINPSSPHVQKFGPHLNLEVQNAAGNTIRTGPFADPHLPISPSTIRPTDF